MKNLLTLFLLSSSIAATASAADQKLELAAPFTDNMILQRESSVPVWGFDAPGNNSRHGRPGPASTFAASA